MARRRSPALGLFFILTLLWFGGADAVRFLTPGGGPEVQGPTGDGSHPDGATSAVPEALERDRVIRVVDGDTVVLERIGKARLVGVDTPETVDPRRPVQAFGKEASAFTRALCEGRVVRVEFEAEREDRYGRALVYLWLDDGTMVNRQIVETGHGFVFTRYPFRHMESFREAARRARAERRGLYADGVVDPREAEPIR